MSIYLIIGGQDPIEQGRWSVIPEVGDYVKAFGEEHRVTKRVFLNAEGKVWIYVG